MQKTAQISSRWIIICLICIVIIFLFCFNPYTSRNILYTLKHTIKTGVPRWNALAFYTVCYFTATCNVTCFWGITNKSNCFTIRTEWKRHTSSPGLIKWIEDLLLPCLKSFPWRFLNLLQLESTWVRSLNAPIHWMWFIYTKTAPIYFGKVKQHLEAM